MRSSRPSCSVPYAFVFVALTAAASALAQPGEVLWQFDTGG